MKVNVIIEPESCAEHETTYLKPGKKTKLKQTTDYQLDGKYWFDDNGATAEVTNTWKGLEVKAAPDSQGRSTVLNYTAKDGSVKKVKIEVA